MVCYCGGQIDGDKKNKLAAAFGISTHLCHRVRGRVCGLQLTVCTLHAGPHLVQQRKVPDGEKNPLKGCGRGGREEVAAVALVVLLLLRRGG